MKWKNIKIGWGGGGGKEISFDDGPWIRLGLRNICARWRCWHRDTAFYFILFFFRLNIFLFFFTYLLFSFKLFVYFFFPKSFVF